MYTVLRYSWWWTVDLSETCRVLYQINLRHLCISLALILRIYHVAWTPECRKSWGIISSVICRGIPSFGNRPKPLKTKEVHSFEKLESDLPCGASWYFSRMNFTNTSLRKSPGSEQRCPWGDAKCTLTLVGSRCWWSACLQLLIPVSNISRLCSVSGCYLTGACERQHILV